MQLNGCLADYCTCVTQDYKRKCSFITSIFLINAAIVTLWVVVTLHLPPPFAEIRGKRGRASYSFPNKDGLHESFRTLISESDRE